MSYGYTGLYESLVGVRIVLKVSKSETCEEYSIIVTGQHPDMPVGCRETVYTFDVEAQATDHAAQLAARYGCPASHLIRQSAFPRAVVTRLETKALETKAPETKD